MSNKCEFDLIIHFLFFIFHERITAMFVTCEPTNIEWAADTTLLTADTLCYVIYAYTKKLYCSICRWTDSVLD